jgi:hypothetical protein
VIVALWLFVVQGVIGAFDTLYYHEWRARLPARGPSAALELYVHAVRDFIYAVLFGTLPWLAWHGLFSAILGVMILAEIILTCYDFIIEKSVRRSLGDVYAGERVTHAIMGIVYGCALAYLVPVQVDWWYLPTRLVIVHVDIPDFLRWGLFMMAAGVLISGLRDLYAALGLPNGGWPWQGSAPVSSDDSGHSPT